jgi:acyl carrier protein
MTERTREEIKALVIDTLAAIAPEVDFSTIAPGKPLREQIDIDSFDFLNVIIRLSERLEVDIPEADYGQLATLDSIVDYQAKKKASGGA